MGALLCESSALGELSYMKIEQDFADRWATRHHRQTMFAWICRQGLVLSQANDDPPVSIPVSAPTGQKILYAKELNGSLIAFLVSCRMKNVASPTVRK